MDRVDGAEIVVAVMGEVFAVDEHCEPVDFRYDRDAEVVVEDEFPGRESGIEGRGSIGRGSLYLRNIFIYARTSFVGFKTDGRRVIMNTDANRDCCPRHVRFGVLQRHRVRPSSEEPQRVDGVDLSLRDDDHNKKEHQTFQIPPHFFDVSCDRVCFFS